MTLYWRRVPADQRLGSAVAMTLLAGELITELVDPDEAPQATADWVRERAVEFGERP